MMTRCFIYAASLLLLGISSRAITAFPQCQTDDSQIGASCDILANDGSGLSWATIDFQFFNAKWDGFLCKGRLAGVRCFSGSGFTATRYNVWECLDTCTLRTPNVGVLIVGAGISGLTAAYDLAKKDNPVTFQILEASSRIGGRLRKLEGFTDFPLDIGGEWIHLDPSILNTIVADANVQILPGKFVDYMPSYDYWDEGEWVSEPWASPDDHKFVNSTWFDFIEDYIALPDEVQNQIVYECQVTSINYASSPVVAGCADGRKFAAEKIIVTAPIKILQSDVISFVPELPSTFTTAINTMVMLSGIKVFLKFSQKFYRDAFSLENDSMAGNERFFFDETFGQDSDDNILGVFMIGPFADQFANLSDSEIVQRLIQDLDAVYANQSSQYLLDSVVQNWNVEEFIGGAYITIPMLEGSGPVDTLQEVVNGKLVFAGEAIPPVFFDWGFAHSAALSGRRAVERLLQVSDKKGK